MRSRMMISLVLAALVAGALSACSAAAALHNEVFAHESSQQDADPITGEWDVTFRVQDTKTPATFKLKLAGDRVTGTVYSEHTGAGTLRDGSWKDNKLSFTLDFPKHESIAISGTLKDGMLSGEFRTEGFVEKWEAKRK
jgi:hypothetical protein